MKKNERKSWAAPAVFAGVMSLLAGFVTVWSVRASSLEQSGDQVTAAGGNEAFSSPVVVPTSAQVTSVPANVALLDRRRQFALGMIETGNQDDEIGRAGEVSRYQIMPAVWKHYSGSSHYQNPEVSLAVAQQHWTALCSSFKQEAHREPSDFDIYVLWNTRHGYYASRGFNPARLHPVVRDRAQRFVNLLERGDS